MHPRPLTRLTSRPLTQPLRHPPPFRRPNSTSSTTSPVTPSSTQRSDVAPTARPAASADPASKPHLIPMETGGPATDAASAAGPDAKAVLAQAPNRPGPWSRSQMERKRGMVGPRFEQMDWTLQPQPMAAISLIHKQPVRWRHERVVSCDGGGGPLGHPRIFINLDRKQICWCTYCGLPFANEHHRKHIEAHPELQTYPLDPTGDSAEVEEIQRVQADDPFGHR